MAQRQHIVHSIPPTFDERSQVLVLGSIPSPKSRELRFNYGHPQNRFWRVMAAIADEPVPATNERKRDFCLRHHIALWDVLAQCDIQGASDASIVNAQPNPLTDITRHAPIEAVFCTGAKAHELYGRLCAEEVGMPAVKLPSTSPANAACKMDDLVKAYAAVFQHVSEFEPPVLDVAQVVALEQTIAASGTPLLELMERAGAAVAHRVAQLVEHARESHSGEYPLVVIFCGNGNNGGDGWVAAELLARAHVPVCLVVARLPEQITAQPARDAAERCLVGLRELDGRIIGADEPLQRESYEPIVLVDDGAASQRDALVRAVEQAGVIVDAILGTGAAKSPRAPFCDWVEAANRCAETHVTLAVDVPTGVDANAGTVAPVCLRADETLTMMVRKPGLAAPECGIVRIAPLAYLEPLL